MPATVVTNAGKAIITNRLSGSGTAPSYLGWGTGTTTAAITDTGLTTAAAEARVNGTMSQQTVTTTNDTFQVIGTLTSASGQSIAEVGLFDAVSAGNLFVHANFTAVPLSIGDSIQFTVKTQFT